MLSCAKFQSTFELLHNGYDQQKNTINIALQLVLSCCPLYIFNLYFALHSAFFPFPFFVLPQLVPLFIFPPFFVSTLFLLSFSVLVLYPILPSTKTSFLQSCVTASCVFHLWAPRHIKAKVLFQKDLCRENGLVNRLN